MYQFKKYLNQRESFASTFRGVGVMVKSNIYIVPFIETRYLENSFNVMYNTHKR